MCRDPKILTSLFLFKCIHDLLANFQYWQLHRWRPTAHCSGSSPKEAALIDQWLSFAITELQTTTRIVLYLVKGIYAPYNKGVSDLHLRVEKLC